MNVRYRVELTQYERKQLEGLLSGGEHRPRRLKRAQILLAADAGVSDGDIAMSVDVVSPRSTGPSGASSKATWSER